MRTTRTESVEIEIVEFVCDDCGEKWVYTPLRPENRCPLTFCRACSKDICRRGCAAYDGDGDYPDAYCKSCWAAGEEYRREVMAGEMATSVAYERWMEACRRDEGERDDHRRHL